MIFKSPGGHSGAMVVTQKTQNFFGRTISNAILPFPLNFHHNIQRGKYFEAKRFRLCEPFGSY